MSTGKADDRLTVPDAAAWLRVGTARVRDWVAEGRIRGEMSAPLAGKPQLMLTRADVERLAQERADRTRRHRGPRTE